MRSCVMLNLNLFFKFFFQKAHLQLRKPLNSLLATLVEFALIFLSVLRLPVRQIFLQSAVQIVRFGFLKYQIEIWLTRHFKLARLFCFYCLMYTLALGINLIR